MSTLLARIRTRSVLATLAILAGLYLAIIDPSVRQTFLNIVNTLISGYVGLSLPRREDDDKV